MRNNALVAALTLMGCAIEDVEYGEIDSHVRSSNRLAGNKLAGNKLAGNKLAASSMSGAVLSQSELAQTADGREVMSFIVSCALPEGVSTVVHVEGRRYTFAGSLGLAPAWATRAPTVAERRWVTACVMARTNLYGEPVDISMRGGHPELGGSLGELLAYVLVEGAFWGDLFDPAGPQLYACQTEIRDLDLALSTQELRACAIPGPDGKTTHCGFTYAGKCSVSDLTLAPACTSLLFPYKNCRAGNGPRFTEVITVSLATSLL